MRKNIFTAIVLSAAIFVFNFANAQQTKEKQTTTPVSPNTSVNTVTKEKQTTPTTLESSTIVNQTEPEPKEMAVKINAWMKTNIGIDEMQSNRINTAATNMISNLREARKNTIDPEVTKKRVHQILWNFNEQVKSVLKPEQLEIYKTKKQDLINSFKEMKDESEKDNN